MAALWVNDESTQTYWCFGNEPISVCICFVGHNAATVTRPNCFPREFSRLKRVSEIQLGVFPEAEMFSVQNFRVKNEIQNSTAEFVSHYGMAARMGWRFGPPDGARRQAGGPPARPARPRARPPDRGRRAWLRA